MFEGKFIRSSFKGDTSYVFIPDECPFGYHLGYFCKVVITGFESLNDNKAEVENEWGHLGLSYEEWETSYKKLNLGALGNEMNFDLSK